MRSSGRGLWWTSVTCAVAAALAGSTSAQTPGTAALPSDEQIRRVLADRVDVHRQAVGIVLGITTPTGRRVYTHGVRATGDTRPLDGDTVFEIGSVSKVFTSLLLADGVRRGDVALSNPVSALLPPGVSVPQRNGRAITLEDLATHRSALPRLPDNLNPQDPLNPYADYSVQQLYQFLARAQLTRDIGAQYEYSNLGAGLLGHALSLKLGADYETLVRARIAGPLGMTRTSVTLSPDMRERLATGHNVSLVPTPHWDLPTLAGAGALRSTVNDMLIFLEAAMGTRSSPLTEAFASMLASPHPTGVPSLQIALGWHVLLVDDRRIVWHNGGTGGFRSWIGYDPATRTGVVLLVNTFTNGGPDDIGKHLLNPKLPLVETFAPPPPPVAPPKPRKETSVLPAILDRYVGRYELPASALMMFSRDGTRFLVQLTGQQPFELFAEDEKHFFLKVVDAQVTFETDAAGQAVAAILHQNGADQRAPRIDTPVAITLDTATLDRYVGRYQVAPNVVLTITRQGTQLFGQPTGQSAQEIVPYAADQFFLKQINGTVRFETAAQGPATVLVLTMNGREQRAPRID